MNTFKIYDADLTDLADEKFDSYGIETEYMDTHELNEHYKQAAYVALFELLESYNLGVKKFEVTNDLFANYTFCGEVDDIKKYLSECFDLDDSIIDEGEYHCQEVM